MPQQKNNRPHLADLHAQNVDDSVRQAMEVDTNVHEDPNRERLLDESFHAFIESIEEP